MLRFMLRLILALLVESLAPSPTREHCKTFYLHEPKPYITVTQWPAGWKRAT